MKVEEAPWRRDVSRQKWLVCKSEEPDMLVVGAAHDAADDPPPLPETITKLTRCLRHKQTCACCWDSLLWGTSCRSWRGKDPYDRGDPYDLASSMLPSKNIPRILKKAASLSNPSLFSDEGARSVLAPAALPLLAVQLLGINNCSSGTSCHRWQGNRPEAVQKSRNHLREVLVHEQL